MDLGLAGKRALVLSSSRGLGLGIAEVLAAEGADVLMTARNAEALAKAAGEITARGAGKAYHVAADLADPGFVETLGRAVETQLGGVDILVNNTGGPPPGRMVDADLDRLAEHFTLMVERIVTLTAHLVPRMQARKWGRIITVGSSGVIQPIPTLGLSNLLRASLVGWSKSLAGDLAADGITVNMLLPGRIHTDRIDELDAAVAKRTNTTVDDVRAASRATIPAGRYGKVEEFASVAAFLASEPAGYVTGSLVRCDGGLIKSV